MSILHKSICELIISRCSSTEYSFKWNYCSRGKLQFTAKGPVG